MPRRSGKTNLAADQSRKQKSQPPAQMHANNGLSLKVSCLDIGRCNITMNKFEYTVADPFSRLP